MSLATQTLGNEADFEIVLVVVDCPAIASINPSRSHRPDIPDLRVFCSDRRGGLSLPGLFGDVQHSMLEIFRKFFSHVASLRLLQHGRNTSGCLDPISLLYIIISSQWLENLHFLQKDLKRIAFEELRRPTIKLNDELLDRREQLAILRGEVLAAQESMFPWAVEFVKGFAIREYPIIFTEGLLQESDRLERFIMDTSQLLVSTLSVLNAEAATNQARLLRTEDEARRTAAEEKKERQRAKDAERHRIATEQADRDRARDEERRRATEAQARRDRERAEREAEVQSRQSAQSTRLAWAAGAYLPLSLATGIFGMNIQEMNGGIPKFWAVIATAIGLVVISIVAFVCLREWEKRKERREMRNNGAAKELERIDGSLG